MQINSSVSHISSQAKAENPFVAELIVQRSQKYQLPTGAPGERLHMLLGCGLSTNLEGFGMILVVYGPSSLAIGGSSLDSHP
jgi:hypothetical protein